MKVNYTAKQGRSSVKFNGEIPIELNKMIVWTLMHPNEAAYLLPAYQQVRNDTKNQTETQQTHCGQDAK